MFVEAVFKTKQDGGYIRVVLKDEKGDDLIEELKVPHEVPAYQIRISHPYMHRDKMIYFEMCLFYS